MIFVQESANNFGRRKGCLPSGLVRRVYFLRESLAALELYLEPQNMGLLRAGSLHDGPELLASGCARFLIFVDVENLHGLKSSVANAVTSEGLLAVSLFEARRLEWGIDG